MESTNGRSTRERILDEAERMFHRKGIGATSINNLIEAADVQRGTLYHYFSGKQELAMHVIRRAGEKHMSFVEQSLSGNTPQTQLYSFLDAALDRHRETRFAGGCLFGNIALEASGEKPEIAEIARNVFDQWADVMARVIEAGQECGQFRTDQTARALAYHVIVVLEGGIMQGRLRRDAEIFRTNIECLKQFLEP